MNCGVQEQFWSLLVPNFNRGVEPKSKSELNWSRGLSRSGFDNGMSKKCYLCTAGTVSEEEDLATRNISKAVSKSGDF